ncbi:hypothetical protein INT45_013692 [Circinella minor]|uniref:MYND-type domain-containing protein n=1 Tax=Circinella minor TaxID=1195481 RepID=A0A8H7SAE1_9FUNG|nr:hypothetical protein INT45_013692 [Circinella minor]
MREPNFSHPSQNRAAIVITSALYDRRALDCTATLPLVNSLTHLGYMTSTSPRIREILAADGGLERLVKILATCQHTDRHSLWKWSLAFQCMVNVGVRGTEEIRSRVVETGAVHIVLAILENFTRALDQARADSKDHERKHQQHNNNHSNNQNQNSPQQQAPQQQTQNNQQLPPTTGGLPTALSLPTVPLQPTQSRSTPITPSRRFFGSLSTTTTTTTAPLSTANNEQQQQQIPSFLSSSSVSSSSSSSDRLFTAPKRRTFLTRTPKPKSKPVDPSLSSIPLLNSLSSEAILHREEDVLLSLQLLAYLSKYPHIRESFHKNHRKNVFSVVEKFTHRLHPATIIYWAGVIMRNACRKDEQRGGIRQCANMHCGKWERYPREFAKCRRCRKAKYCSKACQSKAWAEGHRWWCVERHHATQPPTTTTSSTTAAAAAAVNAGAPQPTQTDLVMPLATHGTTPDVMPIPIDQRENDVMVQQQQQEVEQRPGTPATTITDTTTVTNTTTATNSTAATSIVNSNNNNITNNGQPEPPRFSFNNEHGSSDNDNGESNNSNNNTHATTTPILGDQQSNRREHLHHSRRRNSRSTHSVPSGSSTEVEADVADNNGINMRDLMDID